MSLPGSGEPTVLDLPTCVTEALEKGGEALFLSPHLDDAVLSCGSLIHALASTGRVTVVTVFSAASPPPHTLAARNFLHTSNAPDAETLYALRRTEDRQALGLLGARQVHLGLVDALFRRRGNRALGGALGRLMPELVHRYPTYRYDIAQGRVSRGDRSLDAALTVLPKWLGGPLPDLVFAPLGVGRHVDHLLTRSLGQRLSPRPVFYADFPYVLRTEPDAGFIREHGLRRWSWPHPSPLKEAAITSYRSQVTGLFPDGRVPEAPETYYASPEEGSHEAL